jgi:transcription elongation GreA/GreB family factor
VTAAELKQVRGRLVAFAEEMLAPLARRAFRRAVTPAEVNEMLATVRLADEDTEEKVKYQIVGPYEADLKQGRISVTSPIGRALIGKTVGDTVEVQTPRGARSYEVVGVQFK